MSGYLGARTQIADSGAYNREQADDLFPSKESVVAFSSTGTNITMVKPPVYGIRVLEFTAATGTINLPDMSGQPGGGRFRILKNNATQGSVNINLSGTNDGIWGAVQLKLNADGDFWELQWTGSRFVLTDGHETGADGNGNYDKVSSGTLIGANTITLSSIDANGTRVEDPWVYPHSFSSAPAVSASLISASTTNTPGDDELGILLTFNPSTSGIQSVAQFRQAGQTGFATGDTATVAVMAIGRWYE